MEFEFQNLLKLKNLQRTLTDLLEKIDKEIIQTDVEWLHLKNICEANNSTSMNIPMDNQFVTEDVQKVPPRRIKAEGIDDLTINSVVLNLSPTRQKSVCRDNEEEFDSD